MLRPLTTAVLVLALLPGCESRLVNAAAAVLVEVANELPEAGASPAPAASPTPAAKVSPTPAASRAPAGPGIWTPAWHLEDYATEGRIEALIVEMTNAERAAHGLKPMTMHPRLQAAARQHSVEMVELDYFAHHSPEPEHRTPSQRARRAGYLNQAAENIYTYRTSGEIRMSEAEARRLAEKAMTGWMNSDGHRKNILKEHDHHIGVGVAVRGGEMLATQKFGKLEFELDEVRLQEGENGRALEIRGAHHPETPYTEMAVALDGELVSGTRVAVRPGESLSFSIPVPSDRRHQVALRLYKVSSGYFTRKLFEVEAGTVRTDESTSD